MAGYKLYPGKEYKVYDRQDNIDKNLMDYCN